uniref:Ubiquitin-like protease family profile domain-containing protein n=1 Tax=Lactuca sativa TaxID=4236 RepID=A0A9R1UPP0_LACSA|nr:hypothetical protein LSAT_V11C800438110 [Lactuca sativa]
MLQVLFKKMKYVPQERDHGICFVNPTLISPSTCKWKYKNIDDASRGLADRIHWVLGVLDMKLDTCYYLDSLSSSNFNMQLKQIAMVLYTTQSGSNKRVKLNRCPVQPGSTECGYYMLRFMNEITEEGIEVLVKDNLSTQLMISIRYVKNGQSLLHASSIDDMDGLLTMYPQNNVMIISLETFRRKTRRNPSYNEEVMTKRRSVINSENTLSRKNLVFDKLIFSLSDVNESCKTRENNQLSYNERQNLTSYEEVMIFRSFSLAVDS